MAGTVIVRLPFAGRRAGATLHTPGAELQLVTPSPRAKPGLAVAGATPSSANHMKQPITNVNAKEFCRYTSQLVTLTCCRL